MNDCSFFMLKLHLTIVFHMAVDKRKAILKSVLKLVNRSGFYHLNMKNIAQEAGIATGTIYLYFKGKEELINALYGMVVADFNQYVLEGYDDRNELRFNFNTMLDNAIHFYLNNPDNFSFIEQYTYAPFLFKENQDLNFMLLLPIYKMMNEGKKMNVIKQYDDAILLSLIHGGLNTIIKLHLAKKINLKTATTRKQFFNAIWESVAL
jgi:AcrR family transcriptional regulator